MESRSWCDICGHEMKATTGGWHCPNVSGHRLNLVPPSTGAPDLREGLEAISFEMEAAAYGAHPAVVKSWAKHILALLAGVKKEGGADDLMEAAAILKLLADGEDVSDQRDDARRLARVLFWGWKKEGEDVPPPKTEAVPSGQGEGAKNWEAEAMALASSYGCALSAIGDLKSFLRLVVAKSVNKYGACIYCVRHLDHGHAEGCKLVEIQKRIAAFESPSPATRSGLPAEGSKSSSTPRTGPCITCSLPTDMFWHFGWQHQECHFGEAAPVTPEPPPQGEAG